MVGVEGGGAESEGWEMNEGVKKIEIKQEMQVKERWM